MAGPFKVLLAALSLIISFVQVAYCPHFWLISSIAFFVIITTVELAGYGYSNIHINSDEEEVAMTLFILIWYAGFSMAWPLLVAVKFIEYSNKVPFAAKRLLVDLKKFFKY